MTLRAFNPTMASSTTAAALAQDDRKGVREASPSISSGSRDRFSNVVDHLAPGVTEGVPSHVPKRNPNDKIIIVQPVRKDEMQVRQSPGESAGLIVLTPSSRVALRTSASELSSMGSTALSSMLLVLLLVVWARSPACRARIRSARSTKVSLHSLAHSFLNQALS